MDLVECFREDSLIDIIPTRHIDAIHLVAGTFGPFKPMLKASVPIWLAMLLKRKQKCSIVKPDFLSPDYLKLILSREKQQNEFSEIDPTLFLLSSVIDLESETINLISDIRQIREAKIRQGLMLLDSTHLQSNNILDLEIECIRNFYSFCFNKTNKKS